MTELFLFNVQFTTKPKAGETTRPKLSRSVVATDAERAVKLLNDRFDGVEIVSVSRHKCMADVLLVDTAAIKLQGQPRAWLLPALRKTTA